MIRTLTRVALLLLASLAAIPASAQSGYTQTRHPIVLVHGLLGFDSLLGIYDYFYGLPGELRSGGARVYIANVSSSNYSEVRGEQLIRYLDQLKATYGHTKFNLIGHSHGGSVIWHALRLATLQRHDLKLLRSWATVGTPFLHHRTRGVGNLINLLNVVGDPLGLGQQLLGPLDR